MDQKKYTKRIIYCKKVVELVFHTMQKGIEYDIEND